MNKKIILLSWCIILLFSQPILINANPDSITLNNPTIDGCKCYDPIESYWYDNDAPMWIGKRTASEIDRGYVEWNISGIPDSATITNVVFKYNGWIHNIDCHIHEMLGARPSTSSDQAVYNEAEEGTVYVDIAGFPIVGANQQIDLGASADADVKYQLTHGDWFAIGLQSDNEGTTLISQIYTEEYDAIPDPTLYIEYTIPNPTNDYLALDLTGSQYKGTKTLLAMKQDYKFVYKCSDSNGVTDITYAEIRLDYTNKNVILRVTRGAGDTWTFSEQSDPSNYVVLNIAGSTHSTSGNQKTFNFLVKINWSWGDSSETLGIRAYVIDSTSLSDTDDYSNIFGVEAHIKAYSLVVNDYRCNPSQAVTFSGYWYYDGTIIYPPNNDYQVKVKLSGVQKGSTDTTLVNGYFTINDATAENTVNIYSYTVEASYMGSAGSFNQVIVDKLNVILFSSNYNPIINNYVKTSWNLTREYDSSIVSSFIIDISKDNVLWLNDYTFNHEYDISIIEIVIRYNCTSATDNTYNLNTFTTNYIDISWIDSLPEINYYQAEIIAPYKNILTIVIATFIIIMLYMVYWRLERG